MSSDDEVWHPLSAELDAWAEAKTQATFWWRDDDAIEPTPALDRMLALSARFAVPLGLAVIPAKATAALAERLATEATVDVLQHGFIHKNHAKADERAAEYGPQRPLELRLAEQATGWRMLEAFPRRIPVFVPPWNRYDPELAAGFARQNVKAVSAFGPAKQLPSAIVECNCHVDIISWRTTRGFAGSGKSVKKLVDHLQARRMGSTQSGAATGLLSHHLVHDDGCWVFLADLFSRLEHHSAVRWVRPMEAVRNIMSP